MCRWACAVSLKEPSPPTVVDIPADSNVEMSWQVFGGELNELYWSLIRVRCHNDGLGDDDATLAQQFRLHLHRGISYLATPNKTGNIGDLVALTLEDTE